MSFKHLFGMTGIVCSTLFLSSCATTDSASNSVNIKEHTASYQAKGTAAVSNDIKNILMAGGLDASDPSSPTATTRTAELQKTPARDQREVEALVASLSGKPAAVPEVKNPSTHAPAPTVQKPTEKPATEAVSPTTALALVKPQDSVIEERFKFPDIGPNLKQGEAVDTNTAVAIAIPVAATVVGEQPATQFQNAGRSLKKASRPRNDIVYAKPSVQRF